MQASMVRLSRPVKKRRLRWRSGLRKQACMGSRSATTMRWLKAENWQEVLRDPAALPGDIRAVLEAENGYAEAMLAPDRATARGALQGDARADQGRRFRGSPAGWPVALLYPPQGGGAASALLPGHALRRQAEILSSTATRRRAARASSTSGLPCHSPDHGKLGWSADETGSELYAIRIRDLGAGSTGAGDAADRPEIVTRYRWQSRMDGGFQRVLLCAHR